MRTLDERLGDLKRDGRTALVVYLVGGIEDDWTDHVRAAVDAGADAIELGLPFSDPMIDGPVIQAASVRALERGATTLAILADARSLAIGVPLLAMTYYNLFAHRGLDASARVLAESGVTGTIVPDLPLEEAGEWRTAANAEGIANVLMVAPSTPPARASLIAAETQGFLYAATRMAVTGSGSGDGDVAAVLAATRGATALPIYAGIGIATPAQASAAAAVADGVIVGTAVVREQLDGAGAAGVSRVVALMRAALS